MKHSIKVIGSICMKADSYGQIVKKVLAKIGLDDNVEIVHVKMSLENDEEDILEKYGLNMRCTVSYCPGCNYFWYSNSNKEKYLPALVIDEEIVLDSCFPTEDMLEKTIRNKLGC